MRKADVDRMIEQASDMNQERVDETAKDRHEPWVKTYCGGQPNYTTPFECPRCGHCCREWVGLDREQMRNTPIEFNRGALWAERYLKEKNHG